MTKRHLRVGIIGVGWGAIVHAPAFGLVDGYDVVALCSRQEQKVAAAGESLGISDRSTDWQAFVRRDDLDLISISSPAGMHHPMLLEALAAEKHVLCEKPLALTSAEGLQMAAAAEASDRATLVCFESRWSPERLAIRDLVAQGVVGTPSFVQVTITSASWHPTSRPMSPWMYRRDEGGGFLMGRLSHEIDFIQSLFGKVVAVAADVRHSIEAVETPVGRVTVDADDTSGLLLRLASGGLVVLTTSAAGVNAETNLWEAHGGAGSIVVNRVPGDGTAAGVYSRAGDGEPRPIVPSPADGRFRSDGRRT